MNMKKLTYLTLCGWLCLSTGFGHAAEESKILSVPNKGLKPFAEFKSIKVEEFDKLRANQKNVVLDVRTANEFAANHMPGAINLDVNAPDFEQKVSALDKHQTYLVHCAAGVRSAKACGKMSKLNFTNLYNLEGGFKAWEKAGKPVEK